MLKRRGERIRVKLQRLPEYGAWNFEFLHIKVGASCTPECDDLLFSTVSCEILGRL